MFPFMYRLYFQRYSCLCYFQLLRLPPSSAQASPPAVEHPDLPVHCRPRNTVPVVVEQYTLVLHGHVGISYCRERSKVRGSATSSVHHTPLRTSCMLSTASSRPPLSGRGASCTWHAAASARTGLAGSCLRCAHGEHFLSVEYWRLQTTSYWACRLLPERAWHAFTGSSTHGVHFLSGAVR